MRRASRVVTLAISAVLRRGVGSSSVRSTASSGSQVYETKRAVDEYLLFHYGGASDNMPYDFGPKEALAFPTRLADLCSSLGGGKQRALDIGCSVGGSAFELSRHFDRVVGIDFSQHFVDAANDMKVNGTRGFSMLKQGTMFVQRVAHVPEGIDRQRVEFQQGDACNLDPALGQFDVILASNLLCRLPSPRQFMDKISSFLKPGGHLVLVSPYSWLEEYTKTTEWFGAQDNVDSFTALTSYIDDKKLPLVLKHTQDISFLIREHERKFQYGVSHVAVFVVGGSSGTGTRDL